MMFAEALAVLAGNVALDIALQGAAAAVAVIGVAVVIGGVVCFVTYEQLNNEKAKENLDVVV